MKERFSKQVEYPDFPALDQDTIDQLYITLELRHATDEQIYYDQANELANKIQAKILALHNLNLNQLDQATTVLRKPNGEHLGHFEFNYSRDPFEKSITVSATLNINGIEEEKWQYKSELKPSAEGRKKASQAVNEEIAK